MWLTVHIGPAWHTSALSRTAGMPSTRASAVAGRGITTARPLVSDETGRSATLYNASQLPWPPRAAAQGTTTMRTPTCCARRSVPRRRQAAELRPECFGRQLLREVTTVASQQPQRGDPRAAARQLLVEQRRRPNPGLTSTRCAAYLVPSLDKVRACIDREVRHPLGGALTDLLAPDKVMFQWALGVQR